MKLNNFEQFNPSICISGKMNRLNRITAKIFRKYLSPFNITDSQLTLLFVLTKKEAITQKQLSDFIMIEKSTVHRNLIRLFDKGFLTKEEFPIISITNKGKEFVNSIIPEWEKAMFEIRNILGPDGEEALNIVSSKLQTKNN